MRPNHRVLFIGLVFLPALVGCDKGEEQTVQKEVIRPVKTVQIAGAERGGVRTFAGRIQASNRADLAFRVDGKLAELPVREGDQVKGGQMLAKLDPTDFQIAVNDRQASHDEAKSNYTRAKTLVKDGFISKMDFDRIEANFKNTRAALNLAKQDLSYTVLEAPFAGSVARRLVQNFEEVQAKQPVIELRDLALLEVKFDVPEQLMLKVSNAEATPEEGDNVPVFASFDTVPGKRYPLMLKEVSTRADPQTQTFEATYTMPAPKELTVLPGMTATVTADLSKLVGGTDVFYVPVSAVKGDAGLSAEVWVVDEDTMTVSPRPVEVGTMRGNQIAVAKGLNAGERVVVAGVPFLVEGMKVRLMPSVEQAAPRREDAQRPGTADSDG